MEVPNVLLPRSLVLLFLLPLLLLAQSASADRSSGVKAAGNGSKTSANDNQPASSNIVAVTPTCQTGWDVVSNPTPGTDGNELYGVTSVSANDVWAVGY